VKRLLDRNSITLDASQEILDFGCGCGRMARWWPTVSDSRLFGCDYNSTLVEWCSENLTFMEARGTGLEPPLPYEDGKFALIYALSVFTHLSSDLEQAWLSELRRVLAPGGYLFFSVAGSDFERDLTPGELSDYKAGEAVVRFPEGAGSNLCATFHPPEYVRTRMLTGLEEVDSYTPVRDEGDRMRGPLRQDAYLVRGA
ncbi:MAG TPA: class I SAM-dependent methyltransferase, partial [Solirubrobacterales bacterium]|nr:class I SAM-dependent methyltransferase [Solirubrobacterales bacterium]